MAKSGKPQWSQYFDSNPSVANYFARVRSGNDKEYRTTFFKGKSLHDVLEGWHPTLKRLEQTWPTLLDFEDDLAKKVGPMSIMKPLSERMEDIDSYYDSILKESKPVSASAVAAVKREFAGVGSLALRSKSRTIKGMKLSTNSGNPFFRKRRDVVVQTMPAILDIPEPQLVTQQLLERSWYAAAILGWRGQEGGPEYDDVKQRVVWMFPLAVNINELQFYQPAIEMCQRFNLVPAWVSMDEVDRRITSLFDTKGKGDLVVCTDFKKFDQHINAHLQDCARSIIANQLNTEESSQSWLRDVFPIKYMIPLAYDLNHIRYGKHGMASGSGGTNYDETMLHRALQYEAAQSVGSKLNLASQCLGDDGVLSYPGITVDDVVRSYTQHGLDMQTEKQYASTMDCTYLRRWHHTDFRLDEVCVGVYSTNRALGRLCEQERYYSPSVWGPKMVALRQLSIIENCKYHPLREEFVAYCMKGDKYRLGLDIPGFLSDIDTIAKEATDYMPEFLGYTKSQQSDVNAGISSWWIVQYLRSMI